MYVCFCRLLFCSVWCADKGGQLFIANTMDDLNRLAQSNCTTLLGSLEISELTFDAGDLDRPIQLREISGYLHVENVHDVTALSEILPNLRTIHGRPTELMWKNASDYSCDADVGLVDCLGRKVSLCIRGSEALKVIANSTDEIIMVRKRPGESAELAFLFDNKELCLPRNLECGIEQQDNCNHGNSQASRRGALSLLLSRILKEGRRFGWRRRENFEWKKSCMTRFESATEAPRQNECIDLAEMPSCAFRFG